jgi:hypothetical protein
MKIPKPMSHYNFIFYFRPLMVDFLMPESDRDKGENPIVDSLAMGKLKLFHQIAGIATK